MPNILLFKAIYHNNKQNSQDYSKYEVGVSKTFTINYLQIMLGFLLLFDDAFNYTMTNVVII